MNFELYAGAHARSILLHVHYKKEEGESLGTRLLRTRLTKVTAYSGYSSRIIRNLFGALIKSI